MKNRRTLAEFHPSFGSSSHGFCSTITLDSDQHPSPGRFFDWSYSSTIRLFLQMNFPVASAAESNQILFLVISLSTAELNMVHLQILFGAAELACPTIPLKHTVMELGVLFRIHSYSEWFCIWLAHIVFWFVACLRNDCFSK